MAIFKNKDGGNCIPEENKELSVTLYYRGNKLTKNAIFLNGTLHVFLDEIIYDHSKFKKDTNIPVRYYINGYGIVYHEESNSITKPIKWEYKPHKVGIQTS